MWRKIYNSEAVHKLSRHEGGIVQKKINQKDIKGLESVWILDEIVLVYLMKIAS